MSNLFRKSSHALVVGASRGIGFEFVRQLLQDSKIVHLYATYRTASNAQDLLALAQTQPDRLTPLVMDITDEAQIIAGLNQIKTQHKQLHLAIYCVGVLHDQTLQPEKSLRWIKPENLVRYFQVNSIGAVLLAKHLLPLVKHHDRSLYACISAKVGSIGDNHSGGWYGYRASKAALNMFLRNIALEYGRVSPETIVAALHPGTTDTQLSQPFQGNVPPEKLFPVDRTVRQLLTVLAKLEPADSGQFFSWDGSQLPW